MKRTHLIAGIFVAIFALMLSVNEAVAQSTSVSMSNKQEYRNTLRRVEVKS